MTDLIRLLRSSIGPRVALIGQQESGVQRVAKAVSWVREHFGQPIAVDDLAGLAHMSLSSFHQHFKAVTSMSPLQYQKVLRLHEARRLMLSRMLDWRRRTSRRGSAAIRWALTGPRWAVALRYEPIRNQPQ